ncbi:hypothetical protein ZOSMA_2G02820 [Zostera marina]|uniref:Retrotransposon gag domain-containing protein n=1 Tax=Zostera marina TaxID=29655 RepID=A0A0K9PDH8_ZOSMR|nr:hypothetical protein ZOSMA_2G02820 [Zostera marina]
MKHLDGTTKDKYLPRHLINELRDEFRNLTQGSLSVPEYATMFVRLEGQYSSFCKDEEERARKFVSGLDTSIRMQVMVARTMILKEAPALANTQEKEMKKNLTWKKSGDESEVPNTAKKLKLGTRTLTPAVKLCVHCSKAHENKTCYRLTGACFRCEKLGPIAKDCTLIGRATRQITPVVGDTVARRKLVSAQAFALTDVDEEVTDVITGT